MTPVPCRRCRHRTRKNARYCGICGCPAPRASAVHRCPTPPSGGSMLAWIVLVTLLIGAVRFGAVQSDEQDLSSRRPPATGLIIDFPPEYQADDFATDS